MKRTHILGTVVAIVLAATVPPLALSGPSGSPVAAAPAVTPTPMTMWDTGLTPTLIPWYAEVNTWLAHEERWQRRHRFLLRKRWLERKQDLAQAREAAHERRQNAPQQSAPPQTAAPATYGYVDPYSLPSPWNCIVAVESNGYNVWNTQGSSASGYFQILGSTWNSIPGTPGGAAIDYPFSEQYAMAQALWEQTGGSAWADGC